MQLLRYLIQFGHWAGKDGVMKIPWWLHRMLIIGLTGFGFLAGAYSGFHFMSYLSRLPGNSIPEAMLIALLPICAALGAFVPQMVFRKWIHAKCPADGGEMVIERITVYPGGDHRRVGRRASRYRCKTCGMTK